MLVMRGWVGGIREVRGYQQVFFTEGSLGVLLERCFGGFQKVGVEGLSWTEPPRFLLLSMQAAQAKPKPKR